VAMVTAREKPINDSRGDPANFLVYLCNGDIVEVGPADTLRVTATALELALNGEIVASFDRRHVFNCSRGVRVSPQLG
jgi:hypothetical protein